jgi:uncharacterized protein YbjT (DUF2867 family)
LLSVKVAIVGGHGKTGRAVATALTARGAASVSLGRADWPDLAGAMAGCDASYLVAPNLHPDEPAYVADALAACREAAVGRVVYHSVASPYATAMPHHVGKATSEDLVRRSGLAWTILQPAVYLQNFDLNLPVRVPYDVHAPFGFLDLADLGAAAAVVLLGDGHVGATYELASRTGTVARLAAEAGTAAEHIVPEDQPGLDERELAWLRAMFAYYDEYGLPAGTLTLRALLGQDRPAPETS